MFERPPLLTVAPDGEVRTLEELVGIANAIEIESVDRYATLAEWMERRGERETAATFRDMCELEKRHVEAVGRWAAALHQKVPPAGSFAWRLPPEIGASWDEAQNSSLLTSYRALAIAVTNEERAFAHYSYIAAQATDPEVARQAEAMAREELAHAAELRVRRRRAYHREHPDGGVPQAAAVESLAGFRALERRLEAAAASRHEHIAKALENAGDAASAAFIAEVARHERQRAGGDLQPSPAAEEMRQSGSGDACWALLRSALQPLERMSETYEELVAHAPRDNLLRAEQEALEDVVKRLALIGARIDALDQRR